VSVTTEEDVKEDEDVKEQDEEDDEDDEEAEELVAPDRAVALRRPMRSVCARRRLAGLVVAWRSMEYLLSQVTGAGRAGRSYIESISLPTVLTSQGWLMDRCT